jgi:hypothetical protein
MVVLSGLSLGWNFYPAGLVGHDNDSKRLWGNILPAITARLFRSFLTHINVTQFKNT